MDRETGGFVSLGCGALLALVALGLAAFFGFHVFVDPGGAISDDEGMPGLAAGLCTLVPALGLLVAGAVMAFRGAEGGGAPSAPAAAGSSQVPAIGAGCFTRFMRTTASLATGGVPYFASEVERGERMREEDLLSGVDPNLVLIDDGAIEDNQTYVQGSVGCAACSGLIGLLGLGGTLALVVRSRRPA
jgi:hypothetical protein